MKIILKLLLAFVCVVTVLVAYEVYFPWEDKARERTFHQRLEEKVAAGETKIYLRDLTDFEWERVCATSVYWSEPKSMHYKELLKIIGKNEIDFFVPNKHAYETGVFFIKGNQVLPIYGNYGDVFEQLSSQELSLPCSQLDTKQPAYIDVHQHSSVEGIFYWRIMQ